jgi:glycosyltransferase involved in cell wall biosynthesis
MSTHAGESHADLAASLESIFGQTVCPDQLVLVIEGSFDLEQEKVIAQFSCDFRIADLRLVRLPAACGLAEALNAGLERCTGSYTMRMDSGDLCDPSRVELQLAYIAAHPDTDVVASWSEESFGDGLPSKVKVSSVHHDAIIHALRWRNILAHPTLCIRTEMLRRIGGYRSAHKTLEAYDLCVRLALEGARFHVVPKVLMQLRNQKRSHGKLHTYMNEFRFRLDCLSSGFLNMRQFVIATFVVLLPSVAGERRRPVYVPATRSAVRGGMQSRPDS